MMKPWVSILCLFSLMFGTPALAKWELVFPENYPAKEDLDLFWIGLKLYENQTTANLIGSHSGFAILNNLPASDPVGQYRLTAGRDPGDRSGRM